MPNETKKPVDDETNDNVRKQLPPVAWLLGRDLIASLKWILLYTAFGSKLDARDWMDAKVFPAENQAEADEKWRELHLAHLDEKTETDSQTGSEYWKGKEFWFDYISDTGDGTKATYSIAYLCLSKLWMRQRWETGMPTEDEADVNLEQFPDEQHTKELHRGEFLLVGGDTSYHLSDYATLHLRFQNPFDQAYQDLRKDLHKPALDEMTESERQQELNRLPPIFGIPGNHDYYDMLDGFRRQFRTPIETRSEDKFYPKGDLSAPQLKLQAFKRKQDTSYIALQLPFGWMLWGLDTELGTIDERQRDFFKNTNDKKTPDKLIVATSAPTTYFGKYANPDDEKCSKAFLQLGLARPFVVKKDKEEPELMAHQIRLDLAGDIHQYARYWGPTSSDNPRTTAKAAAPSKKNYASVVSGLGGAFHHPSTTYVDEIREQALYPHEKVSREAVAEEIFNPWKVFKGGGVGVIGAVIALILAFSAIANDSTRPALHNFPLFTALGITEKEQYESTLVGSAPDNEETSSALQAQRTSATMGNARNAISQPAPSPTPFVANEKQPQSVRPFVLWRTLVKDPWEPKLEESNTADEAAKAECKPMLYLWGKCSVIWPVDYTIGSVLLLLTPLVTAWTFYRTEKAYKLAKKHEEDKTGAREPQKDEEEDNKRNAKMVADMLWWGLWPTLAVNVLLGVIGVLSIIPYRPFITPFGNSLWVFLTLFWAVSSIIVSLRYSDWLFIQASKTTVNREDWLITWALTIAVLASLAVGLWLFGKNNLPAYLVADIIFVTVLIATFVGLIYVAVTMGGMHQKGLGKVGMGILGIWHWILQLGVALLLLKKGTWLTVLVAPFIFFAFMALGKWFMKENYKWRLVALWVGYGAVMLALPPLVFKWLAWWNPSSAKTALFWPHPFGPTTSFATYEWWGTYLGFWQLVPLALACFFGLVFSCIWVGWYFAVCLRFNGHNNEAGGAARIENYKQFIRIRLRENDLTAYVIAVDTPKEKGSDMHGDVKIVDVFQLTRSAPKPGVP
jgi:hypothetical protein